MGYKDTNRVILLQVAETISDRPSPNASILIQTKPQPDRESRRMCSGLVPGVVPPRPGRGVGAPPVRVAPLALAAGRLVRLPCRHRLLPFRSGSLHHCFGWVRVCSLYHPDPKWWLGSGPDHLQFYIPRREPVWF
jgi:hypothetical protein